MEIKGVLEKVDEASGVNSIGKPFTRVVYRINETTLSSIEESVNGVALKLVGKNVDAQYDQVERDGKTYINLKFLKEIQGATKKYEAVVIGMCYNNATQYLLKYAENKEEFDQKLIEKTEWFLKKISEIKEKHS